MASPTRLQFLRPFTLRVVNPLTRVAAGWLPGFGLLLYRGRGPRAWLGPVLRGARWRSRLRSHRNGDPLARRLK